jgi:hypothetical protein
MENEAGRVVQMVFERANDQGSLNTRINLLYLLDSLLEISLPLSLVDAPYPPLISENLQEIVRRVVPAGEGILNLKAAKQVSPLEPLYPIHSFSRPPTTGPGS